MTTIKNMAYWRSKNKVKSDGSYDGGNLKAKRSPMKHEVDDFPHEHGPDDSIRPIYPPGVTNPDKDKNWPPPKPPKKDKKDSPNKWAQFIPIAMEMMNKKKEKKEEGGGGGLDIAESPGSKSAV